MKYTGLTRRRAEPQHMCRHLVDSVDEFSAWKQIRKNLPSDWEIVWVHETNPQPSLSVQSG